MVNQPTVNIGSVSREWLWLLALPQRSLPQYCSPFCTVFHNFSLLFAVFHRLPPFSPFPPFATIFHCFPPFFTVFHIFLSLLVSVLLSALVKRVSVFRMQDFSYLLLLMSQKVSFWCETNIHPKADETEALNHQFESCPCSNHTSTKNDLLSFSSFPQATSSFRIWR